MLETLFLLFQCSKTPRWCNCENLRNHHVDSVNFVKTQNVNAQINWQGIVNSFSSNRVFWSQTHFIIYRPVHVILSKPYHNFRPLEANEITYSLNTFKWHKSNIKNFLMKSSKIVFIFLPAFYLIIWLMISLKNFGKISILKIWQLVFFWGVKTYFGEK